MSYKETKTQAVTILVVFLACHNTGWGYGFPDLSGAATSSRKSRLKKRRGRQKLKTAIYVHAYIACVCCLSFVYLLIFMLRNLVSPSLIQSEKKKKKVHVGLHVK